MIENADNVSMHWWAEGNPEGSALRAAYGDKSV